MILMVAELWGMGAEAWAAWTAATATIVLGVIALWGPAWRSHWDRPKLSVHLQREEPHWANYQGEMQPLWYLTIRNEGRTAARGVKVRVTSIDLRDRYGRWTEFGLPGRPRFRWFGEPDPFDGDDARDIGDWDACDFGRVPRPDEEKFMLHFHRWPLSDDPRFDQPRMLVCVEATDLDVRAVCRCMISIEWPSPRVDDRSFPIPVVRELPEWTRPALIAST